MDLLYPECSDGNDVACEIVDVIIGEYWLIVYDWCEQGYTEACDYLDTVGEELYDDCEQGDDLSCDLLDVLYDVTGYQTCEELYDYCVDAGVSEDSCQTIYDECLLNQ